VNGERKAWYIYIYRVGFAGGGRANGEGGIRHWAVQSGGRCDGARCGGGGTEGEVWSGGVEGEVWSGMYGGGGMEGRCGGGSMERDVRRGRYKMCFSGGCQVTVCHRSSSINICKSTVEIGNVIALPSVCTHV
jgi:hypothetical protein